MIIKENLKKTTILIKASYTILLATILCLTFSSYQKRVSLRGTEKRLENIINEDDCKEITNNALQAVLKDLRDVKFDNVLHGVQEDILI